MIETLHCASCDRDLPDDAFSRLTNAHSRRQRAWSCRECKARRYTPRSYPDRRTCSACDRTLRHDDQYICGQCAHLAPMFNHVRPPEMQGRAVPITPPWPTKVREV